MSVVDDILFAPIEPSKKNHDLVDQVLAAFANHTNLRFRIEPTIPLAVYMLINGLIENEPTVFRAARRHVCMTDGLGWQRPTGALDLQEAFVRLHRGEDEFFWTAPGSKYGIESYQFTNYFLIEQGVPVVGMTTGNFNVWSLGLLSKFVGQGRYNAFGNQIDATNYWSKP